MAREQRYIDMKGDDEPEPNASEPKGAPEAAHWGFMSGFCGADSMSFAARELGGVPVAGFDVDETVQRLWSERTGIPCWGEFSSVLDAAADGLLDDLVSSILIYISGSPCPDFSSVGCGRGLLGETGSLWLDDCELGIRLRPPVIIREMVTGIFDVDGGSPFWEAVDRYRGAGYAVGWSVWMARRHGDPTSRRRVFLVASTRVYARRSNGGRVIYRRGDLVRRGDGGDLPRRRTGGRAGGPSGRRHYAADARRGRLRRSPSSRHDRHRRNGLECL